MRQPSRTSVLRRTTTANSTFADLVDLITAVRRGLRQLQYRPEAGRRGPRRHISSM